MCVSMKTMTLSFIYDNNDTYKNTLRSHSMLKAFGKVKLEYKSRGERKVPDVRDYV